MSVLFKEDHEKMLKRYDEWMDNADKRAPEPPKLSGDPTPDQVAKFEEDYKKFEAANAIYESNPGRKILISALSEIPASVDTNSAAFDTILKQKLAAKRAAFIDGLEKGKPGNFSKAFEHFGNFNFMEGIKELFKAIPLIGDFLIVPGKMITALFAGKPIGPMAAYKEALYERALGGALEAAGIAADDKEVRRISALAMAETQPVLDTARQAPKALFGMVQDQSKPQVKAIIAALQREGFARVINDKTSLMILADNTGQPIAYVLGHKDEKGEKFTVDAMIKADGPGGKMIEVEAGVKGQTFDIKPDGTFKDPANLAMIQSKAIAQYKQDGKPAAPVPPVAPAPPVVPVTTVAVAPPVFDKMVAGASPDQMNNPDAKGISSLSVLNDNIIKAADEDFILSNHAISKPEKDAIGALLDKALKADPALLANKIKDMTSVIVRLKDGGFAIASGTMEGDTLKPAVVTTLDGSGKLVVNDKFTGPLAVIAKVPPVPATATAPPALQPPTSDIMDEKLQAQHIDLSNTTGEWAQKVMGIHADAITDYRRSKTNVIEAAITGGKAEKLSAVETKVRALREMLPEAVKLRDKFMASELKKAGMTSAQAEENWKKYAEENLGNIETLDVARIKVLQSDIVFPGAIPFQDAGAAAQPEFRMNGQLKDAVTQFAQLRFADLKTGENNNANYKEKVATFVRKYTAIIQTAKMGEQEQLDHINFINNRLDGIKGIGKRIDERDKAVVPDAGSPPAGNAGMLAGFGRRAAELLKMQQMNKDIQEALGLLAEVDVRLQEDEAKAKTMEPAKLPEALYVETDAKLPDVAQVTPNVLSGAAKGLTPG